MSQTAHALVGRSRAGTARSRAVALMALTALGGARVSADSGCDSICGGRPEFTTDRVDHAPLGMTDTLTPACGET